MAFVSHLLFFKGPIFKGTHTHGQSLEPPKETRARLAPEPRPPPPSPHPSTPTSSASCPCTAARLTPGSRCFSCIPSVFDPGQVPGTQPLCRCWCHYTPHLPAIPACQALKPDPGALSGCPSSLSNPQHTHTHTHTPLALL